MHAQTDQPALPQAARTAPKAFKTPDPPAELLHAMAAACALLATADGHVAESERDRFLQCVTEQRILKEFSRAEILSAFEHYERDLKRDLAGGLRSVFAMLAPLSTRRDDALALVEACWAILSVDGFARKIEFDALDAVRRAMGLTPPIIPAGAAQNTV